MIRIGKEEFEGREWNRGVLEFLQDWNVETGV